jgi:predicted O-methyltransferase YrrM
MTTKGATAMTEFEIPETAFQTAAEALEPFGLGPVDSYDAASDALRAALPGLKAAFSVVLFDLYKGHAPEDARELRGAIRRLAREFSGESADTSGE